MKIKDGFNAALEYMTHLTKKGMLKSSSEVFPDSPDNSTDCTARPPSDRSVMSEIERDARGMWRCTILSPTNRGTRPYVRFISYRNVSVDVLNIPDIVIIPERYDSPEGRMALAKAMNVSDNSDLF